MTVSGGCYLNPVSSNASLMVRNCQIWQSKTEGWKQTYAKISSDSLKNGDSSFQCDESILKFQDFYETFYSKSSVFIFDYGEQIIIKKLQSGGGWVEFNRVNGALAMSRALGDFFFKQNIDNPLHKQIVTGQSQFKYFWVDRSKTLGLYSVQNYRKICIINMV